MRITAIVAMSENRVIGKDNQLPWHLPADLHHFKRLTMGKPILMGRKTHQSIGKALPGRCNVVITRDIDFKASGCVVTNSIATALAAASYSEEVFVIGGATLYQQMLPKLKRIYLTLVHKQFEGDAFFPELNPTDWQEVRRVDHAPDESNQYPYSFITMDRV